jgi:hypothetical protein
MRDRRGSPRLKHCQVWVTPSVPTSRPDFYLRALLKGQLGREAAKELLPTFHEAAEAKAVQQTREQIEIDRVVEGLLADI